MFHGAVWPPVLCWSWRVCALSFPLPPAPPTWLPASCTPKTGVEGSSQPMLTSPPVTVPGGAAGTHWLGLSHFLPRPWNSAPLLSSKSVPKGLKGNLKLNSPCPGSYILIKKCLSALASSSQYLIRIPGERRKWLSSVVGQNHLEVSKPLPGDSVMTSPVVGKAGVSEAGPSG